VVVLCVDHIAAHFSCWPGVRRRETWLFVLSEQVLQLIFKVLNAGRIPCYTVLVSFLSQRSFKE
jgi:hypothetical protein